MNDGLQVADLDLEGLIAREWLVGNGLGGFASSTIAGMNTRRYHGLLVAAMAPPVRRMVLLSRVEECLHVNGREHLLACSEYPGTIYPNGHDHLRAFSTEPFPRWGYQGDGWTIEKQVRLLKGENTVLISYTMWGGSSGADLEIRPLMALRGIHELTHQWQGRLGAEPRGRGHWRISATHRSPEVFFAHDGTFDRKPTWYSNNVYRREFERGYWGQEDLWCPGVVHLRLVPGQPVYFACSTEPFELPYVVLRGTRQQPAPATPLIASRTPQGTARDAAPIEQLQPSTDRDFIELARAADPFILCNKQGDAFGATVQYPWNAPSPRLALAGFVGLYLATGRHAEARSLLLSLLPRLQDGLIPSEFNEETGEPVYRGADVPLWFASAVFQYLNWTGDVGTVRKQLLPAVFQIIDACQEGIDRDGLSIHVDPDGLLVARGNGFSPTWMNAVNDGWVVTQRNGRAVEINALWYNAVRCAAELARRFDSPDRADRLWVLSQTIHNAFSRRFWNDTAGCCFDVVDESGNDPAIRPNQLLALSLPFPVLAGDPVLSEERQIRVIEICRQHLLTPWGLRTLHPKDPSYQAHAGGNALVRDRAYHNGSTFPWLLGPYITARLNVHGRTPAARDELRRLLQPCLERMNNDGLGLIPELFDAAAPHTPGGAITSPLAVAEFLRVFAEDLLTTEPAKAGGRLAGESQDLVVPPNLVSPA